MLSKCLNDGVLCGSNICSGQGGFPSSDTSEPFIKSIGNLFVDNGIGKKNDPIGIGENHLSSTDGQWKTYNEIMLSTKTANGSIQYK